MSDAVPPPPPPETGSTRSSPPANSAGTPASSPGMSGDQVKSAFQGAHKYDLGIIAAGVVAFLFSMFDYYTVSAFGVSGSASAWHGFFGWFAALCALAGAVVLVASLLSVRLPVPTRLTVLALFGVATVCVLLALFVIPGKVDVDGLNYGHGVGYWVSLLAILAGLALSVLRKDSTD